MTLWSLGGGGFCCFWEVEANIGQECAVWPSPLHIGQRSPADLPAVLVGHAGAR